MKEIESKDLKRIIKLLNSNVKVSTEVQEIILDYYKIYGSSGVVYAPFNKVKII